MIFDDERTLRIINNAPNSHIIKIFFYLADEWKRRLDLETEKIRKNRELKRRRELKKLNKQ